MRDEADGSYTQYSVDYSVFGHTSGSLDKLQATNDGVSFRIGITRPGILIQSIGTNLTGREVH